MHSLLVKSLVIVLALYPSAHAAVDRAQATVGKRHKYIEYGTVSGGESSVNAHSLLSVRRIFAPKDNIERLIFDLGDEKGDALKGRASYFQAALDKGGLRAVLEFSQMGAANLSNEKLKEIFSKSPYVSEAKIHYDPVDLSISVQLALKKSVVMEAFLLPAADSNPSSRVALDFKLKNK